MMDAMLKRLFDYQRFDGNPALADVIGAVHARYAARELSLDEMGLLAAAGVPDAPKKKDEKNI